MKYQVGGEYRFNMDARKRIFIPVRIREVLGKNLVLSSDYVKDRCCLCIYSAEGWDERVSRYLADCQSEEDRNEVFSILCSYMIPVELDEQGRVTLTKDLAEYAELKKEVVIAGSGDHATLWAAEAYAELRAKEDRLEKMRRLASHRYGTPLALSGEEQE